jgi:hypothetical protein
MANVSLDPIDILLELGFDLDEISDDKGYQSALKEGIVTIEFRTGGSGDERSRALREELIKTRKKGSKKTTVDAAKAFISPKALPGGVGRRGGALTVGQTLLSSSAKNKQQQQQKKTSVFDVIADSLNAVANSLNNVAKSISELLGVERQTAEAARRGAVTATRQKEEKDRLAGAKKLIGGITGFATNAVKKPVMGILDRMRTFLGNVAAGSVVGWLTSEENKDKVLGVFNFLEEHMGKIMTAIIAFLAIDLGLKLITFINTLIGLVKGLSAILTNPAFLFALAGIATKMRENKEITRLAEAEAERRDMTVDEVLAEREEAKKDPLTAIGIALGDAFSSGGLELGGFGGGGLFSMLDVDPKSKPKPVRQLSEEDSAYYNEMIANLKPGSEEKVKIPGLGTVLAGRNLFGQPETKYFDLNGNQLSKQQWAQKMADAGNPEGSKAAVGFAVKPTPKPQAPKPVEGAFSATEGIKLDQNFDFGATAPEIDLSSLGGGSGSSGDSGGGGSSSSGSPTENLSYGEIASASVQRTNAKQQQLDNMNLSAVDYFGGGSVVSQMEELKSAMANGGMSAGASADQQEVPSFSAVDLTNDNIFMTSGIYNSPS